MKPQEIKTDVQLAVEQWNGLIEKLREIGAEVIEMPGQPNLPDMVFTANAGLIFDDKKVVLSSFKHPERQPEAKYYGEFLASVGYEIVETFAPELFFEGAGDALFQEKSDKHYCRTLYFGYGFRSDYKAVCDPRWGSIWREQIRYMKLINPYFYHLDTCFCPLKNNYALIFPGAFEEKTVSLVGNSLDLIKVPEKDARKFACNAVSVDDKIVIPSGCDDTRKLLEKSGFEVFETDMSQYILSGGACKCLTLKLN
jgi:N-dimethylarginine dimethylaminohydrolase